MVTAMDYKKILVGVWLVWMFSNLVYKPFEGLWFALGTLTFTVFLLQNQQEQLEQMIKPIQLSPPPAESTNISWAEFVNELEHY